MCRGVLVDHGHHQVAYNLTMADIEAETCTCWQLVYLLATDKDSCVVTARLPYMYSSNTVGMSHLKVGFYVFWIFAFLYSVITFWSVLPQRRYEQRCILREYTVVLHVLFFECTFKLSINWHVALVSRTYVGCNGKEVILVIIFCLLHCLHVMVIVRCVQWSNPFQLLTWLRSQNVVVRPTPVSVAQLANPCTKHMAWKMFATHVEWTWCGSLE
jgi:hypothetical protein